MEENDLKETFRKIFDKVGVKSNSNYIETCHRLGNRGNTTVKIVRRKDYQDVLKIKKDLSLKVKVLENKPCYCHQDFCKPQPLCILQILWSKSKALH